jgi:quercetin dioxygenase-like cupin family protein
MLSASLQNTLSMSSPDVQTNPPISLPGSSLLARANEGRRLQAFGDTLVILLDGKQTGETFTAFLYISPPGAGPGPHYHEREDEWFYVVEGQVSFLLNGTWTDLFPGDCAYAPRGSVHAFKNNTDQPIRMLINATPAGFERFFTEVAEEWEKTEPDTSRIATIAEKYGLHSVNL